MTYTSPEGVVVTHVKVGSGALVPFTNPRQLAEVDPQAQPIHRAALQQG